jgi:hypothetical protein
MAQLLATEHWSLLASRSTTQSEVLTRISIFLLLTSAGLVSLALVGQATEFSEVFRVFAITVLSLLTLVGILTQVRVLNVGMEDLMYVLAMNRLRAAYVELDAAIEPYLLASWHDDQRGAERTYYFLSRRSDLSQVAGSSMVFIITVNSALIGLLGAAITSVAGGVVAVMAVVGAVCGLGWFVGSLLVGARSYRRVWEVYRPVRPTPPD